MLNLTITFFIVLLFVIRICETTHSQNLINILSVDLPCNFKDNTKNLCSEKITKIPQICQKKSASIWTKFSKLKNWNNQSCPNSNNLFQEIISKQKWTSLHRKKNFYIILVDIFSTFNNGLKQISAIRRLKTLHVEFQFKFGGLNSLHKAEIIRKFLKASIAN